MKSIVTALVIVASLAVSSQALTEQHGWFKVSNGTWDPPEQMVIDIKTTIEAYVMAEAARSSRELHPWPEYSFQFGGDASQGTRFVLVNAFCTPPPPEPERNMVYVLDGGSCYFTVKYNPDKSQFYDLRINGEA